MRKKQNDACAQYNNYTGTLVTECIWNAGGCVVTPKLSAVNKDKPMQRQFLMGPEHLNLMQCILTIAREYIASCVIAGGSSELDL